LKELEEIGRFECRQDDDSFMHFQSCTINNGQVALFLQSRNGQILYLSYENNQFILMDSSFSCSSLTFCRLAAESKGLLAFPSPRTENSIDLIDLQSGKYLLESFTIPGNGMCMFTKFYEDSLLIGFETGRLCRMDYLRKEIIFNEVVIEDSCNDAIFVKNLLFAVGASSKVVCWQQGKTEVPFAGFNSIASVEDEFLITGGWDAK
jgi:hypothetical protein